MDSQHPLQQLPFFYNTLVFFIILNGWYIHPFPVTAPTRVNAMYQTDADQMQRIINYLRPMLKNNVILHPHTHMEHIVQKLKIARRSLYQNSPVK